MSRIVIIQGHPDTSEDRFCRALAQAYINGATAAGHDVDLIDIARLDFPLIRSEAQFVDGSVPPDIQQAQTKIRDASHIVFIYPLWLGTMPALMKAALEQIFRYGFGTPKAGEPLKRLLKGRSARIIITMGMPAWLYRWYFRAHSLKSLERNILWLCGIGPFRETLIGGTGLSHPDKRAKWLRKMEALGAKAR